MRQSSKNKRRNRDCREGVVCVDFALTFPLVLGIFMSMLFFVQAFLYKNTSSNACFEAARVGVIVGTTKEEMVEKADQILGALGVRERIITIDETNDTVTVTVAIPMKGNSWATGTLFPIDVSIGESCTLRKQTE
jgi:Flp pilus assembly protein TadG